MEFPPIPDNGMYPPPGVGAPPGLLGGFSGMDPQKAGLLAAAFQGLQASGPSRTPVSLGQTLGQAGQAGMQAQRQGVQDQMKQQAFGMQAQMQALTMAQHAEALKKAQRQEQYFKAYASTLPASEQPAFFANPSGYITEKMKTQKVSPGDILVRGDKSVFSAEAKPETRVDASGVLRYTTGPKIGQPVQGFDTPRAPEGMKYNAAGELEAIPGYVGMRKEIAAAGATRVNPTNIMTSEKEESKVVGKHFGETYANIQQAGFNAPAKIAKLDRLNQLLEGVNTGKLTPAGTELASLAESLGFKIDKNLGNKIAAQSLANEMALELRNPAGGAGMPGAMSDSDRVFLTSMVPGLSTTPEGRKLMSETARKIAQRDQDVARLARQYRTKHGSLNEGFYEELRQYSDANPLFGPGPAAPRPAPGLPKPAAPRVVDFDKLP